MSTEKSDAGGCLLTGNACRSKPIRRPQLKKVLNQYIAPIPEESEEVTPPVLQPKKGSAGKNTAVVMTNNMGTVDQEAARGRAEAVPQRAADKQPPLNGLKASNDVPVSPFSTS